MKFNVMNEAMYQIKQLGIEDKEYTIKHKGGDAERVIVEIRFSDELMRKLVPLSNSISYLPHVEGITRYISFNTMRGSEGDRLDFHLV
jgi:hypothetical protein